METLKKRCVEIYEETQMGTQAIYSALATERESATTTCVWQGPRGKQERGKTLERKVRLQAYSDWRLMAGGSWRWAS